MEFGWINLLGGLIVALIILPNIIYALKKKEQTVEGNVPKSVVIFEQIGRYGCIVLMWLPLFVWKFYFDNNVLFGVYLIGNGGLILAYFLIWIFYSKNKSRIKGIFLAVIPTTIFLISGICLHHWLLILASIVFGIAHIWITDVTHKTETKDL